MPSPKISRIRWTPQERQRLLHIKNAFPDLTWRQIQARNFPDRTPLALCKEYSVSDNPVFLIVLTLCPTDIFKSSRIIGSKKADVKPNRSNTKSMNGVPKRGRGPGEDMGKRPQKQAKTSQNDTDDCSESHSSGDESSTSDQTDWELGDIDHTVGMVSPRTSHGLRSRPSNQLSASGIVSSSNRAPVTESAGLSTRSSQMMTVPQGPNELSKTAPVTSRKSPSASPSLSRDSTPQPQDPVHKSSSPKPQMLPPPALAPSILPVFGENDMPDDIISMFLMRASVAVKQYASERARADQHKAEAVSFQQEIKQLKDLLAEKENQITNQEKQVKELSDSVQKQKEEHEKQTNQIKGLEADLQQLRESRDADGPKKPPCKTCMDNIQLTESLAELRRCLKIYEDTHKAAGTACA
ncbi:uncharacterized protein ACLA_052050 [Aspergillus clavatus NRRL 1]|uniref:Myb-like domain-containing protein n=1 Tax=Aspergillus clavatus (strain ATCC 1007 / CBS 513.65 / DSM 816 / NCTC 3887 / NRRL 1 / QM 1276 / 107) TaxID=344612 RepID=A1CIM8_ASPCL|nr:uncharacterized protein ACLA_052050 [Aspergillus clavatus NRRL 1]EAW10733.1 conserved hypothetical protein [Aspergillus clavatus NRRL 1]